jgi:hypothetical protein
MQNRTAPLFNLSPDILNKEVVKPDNLDTHSVINLSLANKYTYQLFKPSLLQRLIKYLERNATTQIKTLIKAYPNFNLPDLHPICKKALELGDFATTKEIIKANPAVLKLNNIELPKKLLNESNTYNFGAILAAIESNNNIKKTLSEFRSDLDKTVNEKGFPFQALLDAYQLYNEHALRWQEESWSSSPQEPDKGAIFSVNVIGYLQRLSPAWLRKILVLGFAAINEEDEAIELSFAMIKDNISQQALSRANKFILGDNQSLDPSLDLPNSGLGYDFCVNVLMLPSGPTTGISQPYTGASFSSAGYNELIVQAFKELFNAKTKELDDLVAIQKTEELRTENNFTTENSDKNCVSCKLF